MAGQHKPRFVGTGAIDDEERDVFGRVARRVQDFDRDIAEFEDLAIANRTEGKAYFGFGEQNVCSTDGLGQLAPGPDFVGLSCYGQRSPKAPLSLTEHRATSA